MKFFWQSLGKGTSSSRAASPSSFQEEQTREEVQRRCLGMKQGPVAYKEMLQTPGLIRTAKKAEKIFVSLYQDGMRPTSRRKLVKPKANTAVNYPRSFSSNKNSAKIWDKVLQQTQGAKHDSKREQLPQSQRILPGLRPPLDHPPLLVL